MIIRGVNLGGLFMAMMAVFVTGVADADTTPSSRSATNVIQVASPRTDGTAARVSRSTSSGSGNSGAQETGAATSGRTSSGAVARSAARRNTMNTSTVSRAAVAPTQVRSAATTARGGVVRSGVVSGAGASRGATTSRAAATNMVRSATHNASLARSASNSSVVGASRAASARATAVFTDIDSIGGGYAQCREAYATCMDQFCANANDTYRRCVCSARYDDIRNTESAIDMALGMLAQFENNNLAAVELSAEEVSAMYSATEGENAIRQDTSAANEMLMEINALLSGETGPKSESSNSIEVAGLIPVSFDNDFSDIWSGGGNSIFDSQDGGVDYTTLTGQELYNQVNKQCLELVADSCENDAVLNMARSAYSILIAQDCNTYEKRVDAQQETLESTVRTAEKYLRDARLEEYRSHNSADVNECVAAVRSAILTDVACGPNFEKCMDYTGAYVNASTGEPIYSPRLFEMQDLILLPGVGDDGAGDILGENPEFNEFLDGKRMFAESALDTCRDMSDIVWSEFKRQALIEIAQAQDEKIEEVRMSCVSTMAECYDAQAGQLRDFGDTTAQYSGALSAYAAREMCQDQVIACASLYGDTDDCEFDGNGQLTTGNAAGATANDRCGLTALLNFVDSVDTIRIAEGCETALENYLQKKCTPTTGDIGYPWDCRSVSINDMRDDLENFAGITCNFADDKALGTGVDSSVDALINDAVQTVMDELAAQMADQCETLDGYWVDSQDFNSLMYGEGAAGAENPAGADGTLLQAFYTAAFGGNQMTNLGRCVENSTMVRCLAYNSGADDADAVARYDAERDECIFSDAWYEQQCTEKLGGYYETADSTCYVSNGGV